MIPHAAPVLKILVVDDEPGFRTLLRWELEQCGMQVETAKNGVEGIEQIKNARFDVVITDITMPEMDGLKFLDEIKKVAPKTEVIVTTGFGAVETAVHSMKRGAFDFILKPYDVQDVVVRIRQAVNTIVGCHECGRVRYV